MSKRVKDLITKDLSQRFSNLDEAVIIEFTGIAGEEMRDFRD